MSEKFELLRDALDDLAGFVSERYAGYPPEDRRFARDFAVVARAREALAELERASQTGSGEAVVKRHLIAGAIEIIQGGADSLRECHCMNGDWGSDVEAKHAYGAEISVADGLRAALATQSPEAIDAACASLDGPREG